MWFIVCKKILSGIISVTRSDSALIFVVGIALFLRFLISDIFVVSIRFALFFRILIRVILAFTIRFALFVRILFGGMYAVRSRFVLI